MNNIDGRRLSDSIREEIRFKAIKDWNAGMSPTNLAHKYGTSRKIVYQWIDRYKLKWFNDLGHLVKHNSTIDDEVESDKAA
ncbi:helix-turn-helix domain-containing protein [Endozoicomonas sp. ALB115]|uniref:helix-turn-helix domain-containing protein n=1 Tax=Endozoicomonas sp. ALB115 TaxID=3403074 RepID=UPI003BB6D984